MKRVVVFFLMILGLIGCGTKEEVKEGIGDLEFKGKNSYGFDVPMETFEFSYYGKFRENPDRVKEQLELMNEYLLNEFNIVIDRKSFDGDGNERLNLMIASGDYPDVLTGLTRTDVLRLIDLGIAIDIATYVDENGENIKKELGDLYGRYLEEDKSLYGLPYAWGILNIPDQSAFIRWDWYNDMGSPRFETPEEYYEILKGMLLEHPTNENGEKTYAMSWNDRTRVEILAGIWGMKEGYKDTGKELIHWTNTSEGYELTKFMNKIHREGMLDPDAFSNTFEEWMRKVSTGRVIGGVGPWYQSWSAGHEVWQKSNEDWTEDERFVQFALKDNKAERAYLSPKNVMGNGYTVITNKARNPEMIMRVLDTMVTPMGSRLMSWGVPNRTESNWNYSDGSWEFTELARDGVINSTLNYQENSKLGGNMIWLIHPQGEFSDDPSTNAWIDQCFNSDAKWKKLLNENMMGTVYDNSPMRAIAFKPEDSITLSKQQVRDTIDLYWTTTVISNSDEEFDKNWESFREAIKVAGVEELQEYMSSEYSSIKNKWGIE